VPVPDHLHVTSEQEFGVRYQVKVDAAVPPALPVFGVEPQPSTQEPKLLEESNFKKEERVLRSVGPGQRPEPMECKLASPFLREAEEKPLSDPQTRRTALTLHGVYRGLKLDQNTPIALQPLAEVTYSDYPEPRSCGIAVRADDAVYK